MSSQKPQVTIKHIADALDMNHATVSRALNDHPKVSADTKARVKEAAQALGYVANSGARLMRSGTSRFVGLIVPDIQNEFFAAAAQAMAQRSASLGLQLMLGLSADEPAREQQQLHALRESRVAGVLIVPCSRPTAETVRLLHQVPTVQFLRFQPAIGSIGVRADDQAGIFAATEHLIQLGHRRIGFIGTPRELSTGSQRIAGYLAALERHAIPVDPQGIHLGPAQPQTGHAAVHALVAAADRPSALVVASSRQLLGAMRALQSLRIRLPADLSLVGYGDTEWFQACTPAISAVSLPVGDMSERATDLLFRLMRPGDEPPPDAGVASSPTQLVIRGTTRRLRSDG